MGFALRLGISKTLGRLPLVGRLFEQPAAFGVLDGDAYVDVWRRAMRTTRVFQAAALLLFSVVAKLALSRVVPA